jgi:hypothetical protein
MNHRIKKKIKKRLQSCIIQQFDENKRKFLPIFRTYREIKNERKRFHKMFIHYRHITNNPAGYSYQLRTCRCSRKDV